MIQDLVCGVNLHYEVSLRYGTARAYIPSFVNNEILEVSLPNFYYDSNQGYSQSWITSVVESVTTNLRNYLTNNITDFGYLSFNNAYVNWAPTDLATDWFSGSSFNLPLICYIEDVETEDSSSSPDYTQILTDINTNLSNLNSIKNSLKNVISCFSNVGSAQDNTSGSYIANNSFFRSILRSITSDIINVELGSFLYKILNCLKQSVSPNASITDVISALNTNIHNDLTEINTTTNNKDTVLIVDGQQDFVIRKQNNDDYDS